MDKPTYKTRGKRQLPKSTHFMHYKKAWTRTSHLLLEEEDKNTTTTNSFCIHITHTDTHIDYFSISKLRLLAAVYQKKF